MSSRLPDLLDPWRAVDNRTELEGHVPLASLPRLHGLLLDSTGEAAFRVRFTRDAQGRAVVFGEVRALLTVRCQRCLEAVELPVRVRLSLALVRGLDEARELPDNYDPLLPEGAPIRPRELIEEELLLALPHIPRHPPGACEAAAQGDGTQAEAHSARVSPFAELERLKGKRRT